MLLSDLCRGQRRDAGLLVVAFGSPGGDHRIWDLERLIEYGRGDDGVGSKVPNVVAQFAPRTDERRLDVISAEGTRSFRAMKIRHPWPVAKHAARRWPAHWLPRPTSCSSTVLISHDRRLLERFSRSTVWLDRGVTRVLDEGFSAFEAWRSSSGPASCM
jgi:hypothetical protein